MALQPIWIPAPSLLKCAACSYTVASIPTRLRAAAVARPPMPAPIIEMGRGVAMDSGNEMAKLLDRRRPIDVHHLIAVFEQLADRRPPRFAASARDNHAFHSGSLVRTTITKWPPF